jgi:hypothetical protein
MSVYSPDASFDMNDISLGNPDGIQGGAYFSRLKYKGNILLVQAPASSTKNGIVVTGKKTYTDLLFGKDEEVFLAWLTSLEQKIQTIVFEKRQTWFDNDLDSDDIEYLFTSLTRTYKSKSYLLRSHVQQSKHFKNKNNVKVYDEQEEPLTLDQVKDSRIISILEIAGLRFTSNSFRVDIYLRQVMVLEDADLMGKCMINSQVQVQRETKSIAESLPEQVVEEFEEEEVDASGVTILLEALPVPEEEKGEEQVSTDEPESVLDCSSSSLAEPKPLDTNHLAKTLGEELAEIELPAISDLETMTLKEPSEVYREVYLEARRKAKEAKKDAIKAHLEAQSIKQTYMLDDVESSEDEESAEAF